MRGSGKRYQAGMVKKSDIRGDIMNKPHKPPKPLFNQSDITDDTIMYACLWHKEGDSIKEIATQFQRPETQIYEIIANAMMSGEYVRVTSAMMKGYHGRRMKKKVRLTA